MIIHMKPTMLVQILRSYLISCHIHIRYLKLKRDMRIAYKLKIKQCKEIIVKGKGIFQLGKKHGGILEITGLR